MKEEAESPESAALDVPPQQEQAQFLSSLMAMMFTWRYGIQSLLLSFLFIFFFLSQCGEGRGKLAGSSSDSFE